MSIETNTLAMRRFTEFINTGDKKLAEELIAPNVIFWVPGRPQPMRGLAGYMDILGIDARRIFRYPVDSGRDHHGRRQVAARFTIRGTHNGVSLALRQLARRSM